MDLTKNNITVYASRFYTNETCSCVEEFEEDLARCKLAKRLVSSIAMGRSCNLRLLCNHVLCFTNNFELEAAKKMLMFGATEGEKSIIKTILDFFGFLDDNDYIDVEKCEKTKLLLNEMDK